MNSMPVDLVVAGLVATATSATAQDVRTNETSAANALHAYVPDRQGSSLFVVTHKAGLLGFLGHEHAIVPEEWNASLCMNMPVPPGARGSITISTPALVIDSDSARTLAGLGGGPGGDDLLEIRRTLLGPEYLAAEQHPRITLEVDSTAPAEEGSLLAHGRLTIRGTERPVAVSVQVESVAPGVVRLGGTLRVRQTEFGMTPQSVAGVVNVADEVDLHFSILANRTDRTCSSPGPPERENGPPG